MGCRASHRFSVFLSVAAMFQAISANMLATTPPIVMKGTKFFYENGTQFFIKGIAYQQDIPANGAPSGSTFVDPLADPALCERHVPILAAAGTNTIRTYAIDPTADHSECMAMLQAAGIYVISDLSEPTLSINRADPQWNTELYDRYTAVIDEMAKYSNVIGFFAGNEVANNASNTAASAFVKAAVRDTKAYIATHVDRWMGVGYAANDDADIRTDMAHYFNCGEQEAAIDFWGYNIYEWCGKSTFVDSGYAVQVQFFANYSVPVFFAEYGCNTVGGADGRLWEETSTLYSDDMTDVISGGIVYMFFEETNNYGLVSVDPHGEASVMKNYASLQSRVLAASPSSTVMADYTPTNSPANCPSVGVTWAANEVLPPTPDTEACRCMFDSVSCAPAPGLSLKAFGAIFDYICAQPGGLCAGIAADASAGVYGAFSMCNATEKLAHVLDAYYQAHGNAASACDFGSQAVRVGLGPRADAGTCSAMLSSASSVNSIAATAAGGTIPSPTATNPAAGGTTASSDGSKSAASSSRIKERAAIADLVLVFYLVVAGVVGIAILPLA